jgi:DNA-binding NtrC family response regulator
MTGLELAARLKALNPACEIVFMTGCGTIENAIEAIKLGVYDYLRKPFSISEVGFCLGRFRDRKLLQERIRKPSSVTFI